MTATHGEGAQRVLCAHADQNGDGAHWLPPGEECRYFDEQPDPPYPGDEHYDRKTPQPALASINDKIADHAWGVTQTILHDPYHPDVPGNCLQAAIASLLGLPLNAVPHFVTFTWWVGAIELWARGRGLHFRAAKVADAGEIPLFRHILSGQTERGISHVVIAEEGWVVWDPHPSRAGLTSVDTAWWFEPLDDYPDEAKKCCLCGQNPSDNGGPT